MAVDGILSMLRRGSSLIPALLDFTAGSGCLPLVRYGPRGIMRGLAPCRLVEVHWPASFTWGCSHLLLSPRLGRVAFPEHARTRWLVLLLLILRFHYLVTSKFPK